MEVELGEPGARKYRTCVCILRTPKGMPPLPQNILPISSVFALGRAHSAQITSDEVKGVKKLRPQDTDVLLRVMQIADSPSNLDAMQYILFQFDFKDYDQFILECPPP